MEETHETPSFIDCLTGKAMGLATKKFIAVR